MMLPAHESYSKTWQNLTWKLIIVVFHENLLLILVYGDVEITPKEIVEYRERIGTDIATILDSSGDNNC